MTRRFVIYCHKKNDGSIDVYKRINIFQIISIRYSGIVNNILSRFSKDN